MSNQIVNKTRRNFLKGATYGSAIAVTGFSTLLNTVFADNSGSVMNHSQDHLLDERILGDSDIRIIQETLNDREKVTLINQSGKLQMLDARQPISLHQSNGKLIVTVNQNDTEAVNGMVLMSPNEHLTFDVKALGMDLNSKVSTPTLASIAEKQLQISSEHSVFNRIVAVELV